MRHKPADSRRRRNDPIDLVDEDNVDIGDYYWRRARGAK